MNVVHPKSEMMVILKIEDRFNEVIMNNEKYVFSVFGER